MQISKDIKQNIKKIKELLNNNEDITMREFMCENTKLCLIYLYEQTDYEVVENSVIKPILEAKEVKRPLHNFLTEHVIFNGKVEKCDTIEDLSMGILKANAILLIDKENIALKLHVSNFPKRNVVEPPTSEVIAGPREGFVENICVNVGLIRRRLPTTALQFEKFEIGFYTKTKIIVAYLNDIADKKIVSKIVERIKKINIDGIIDSHYLVSFLEERKNSIFKQVGKSEKPDVVVAKMLEGRVAILVDGSPMILTLPFMLLEDLQNSDDYYQKSFKISFIRLVRLFGLLMSILLPGLYVAIQLFHYRIIPLKFLVTLMNTTQGLPFTPFLEILFVIVLFEMLFEASLRMPKFLGMALSIVGTLILGDTAVKAGLISPPSVMIVAVTNISFYTIPEETPQLSILRIVFTLIGGSVGVYGLIAGVIYLIAHLTEFNAYGTPYFAPYSPYINNDVADGIFKLQNFSLNRRPKSIPTKKKKRLEITEEEK